MIWWMHGGVHTGYTNPIFDGPKTLKNRQLQQHRVPSKITIQQSHGFTTSTHNY